MRAESKPPPVALVSACMEALRRSRDARFLVPALASLDRQEALLHLPRLLALDAAHFTAGIHRLLLLQPETGASRGRLPRQHSEPRLPQCGV